MNYFKTFMANLWVYVKDHLKTVGRNIFNPIFSGRTKARDALDRTRNAYYAITHFPVKDQITEHHLDYIIRSVSSTQELPRMLEQAGIYDETYAFLLVMAIFEVYRSPNPPELNSADRPRLIK